MGPNYTENQRKSGYIYKLTDRQQEIIQLYFYKGLNQYEIAEELGIVRPVVSKIMAAAIKRLKKSF